MRIPKRFKLLGLTYEVKEVDTLASDDNAHGMVMYNHCEIHLQRSSPAFRLTPEKRGQTFCHELTHAILYHATGDADIYQDEQLVDTVGSLLHQALTTMEFK